MPYNLLLGTPTGASLDLFSTDRESCFTASFGRWRGRLSQSPPSAIMTVPFINFPAKFIMLDKFPMKQRGKREG